MKTASLFFWSVFLVVFSSWMTQWILKSPPQGIAKRESSVSKSTNPAPERDSPNPETKIAEKVASEAASRVNLTEKSPPLASKSQEDSTKVEEKPRKEEKDYSKRKLQVLGETVVLAGTEPTAIADEGLVLFADSKPEPSSVKGAILDGALQYDLKGLPQGMMGAFLVRQPTANGIRGYDAIVHVPFDEPTTLEGLPRRFVRVILTVGVDKDWKLHHYAVNTEVPVDGNLARKNGIEPTLTPFRQGIAYQMGIDGNIFVHRIEDHGRISLDPSLLLGPERLTAETQERLLRLLREWARSVNQEKFS